MPKFNSYQEAVEYRNEKLAQDYYNQESKAECRCKNGYIKYWYDDFDKMSAKDKLSWLKFEYEEEYAELSKEDKREFIRTGEVPCPICN